MTIGVLGCGNMGAALATALDAASYPVLLAGREPASAGRVASGLPNTSALDVATLLRRASPLLLAVSFEVAREVMASPLAAAGAGRVLVDVTNPSWGTGVPSRAVRLRSGGEVLAASLPTWRVVKAFNSVSADTFSAPPALRRQVTLPIASDHEDAKAEIAVLARRLGFEPVDVGGIAHSGELEQLASLLASVARRHGLAGRVGFHLTRFDAPSTTARPAAGPEPHWRERCPLRSHQRPDRWSRS